MKNKTRMKALCFILTIYTLISGFTFVVSAEKTTNADDESDAYLYENCVPTLAENVEVGSRFYELFFGKGENEERISLIAGGDVFGIKIKQKYVTVTDAPGVPALKAGDVILSVGGESVHSAKDVRRIVEKCGGTSLTIRAMHKGNEIAVEIRPSLENGEYRLGISLRDGAAGLGTVTFIDPKTGIFGGLGHGVCDADSGEVVSLESGDVLGAILGGIHKGESGKPGELCGILTDKDMGDILVNCECGVFGRMSEIHSSKDLIEVGRREEVVEGEATIISTLKNGKTSEYKIEIYDVDYNSTGSKSFRIRVTDETLKALTGGIVRGMSGSPIIQNGRLVGAVTHVLVADPTEGYGIFIENMLNYAGISGQRKAA